MGESILGYSPIQLKLENQQRVLPIGRLKGVTIHLDGVRSMENFEIIEIIYGTTLYPTLLGMDWAFDNQAIINLNTRKMTFESGEYSHWAIRSVRRRKVCRTHSFISGGNKPIV
jgi:hypothetical protein